MAEPAARNLVVCCDGTSNEIGVLLSNVLKLYRIAEKSDRQITYYHPGVGTVAMPNAWGRWRQKARSILEMATGIGVDRDVLNAYCFICRHYQPGDRIFLFGFSRGAYTVRIVAGLIYLIGLLREDQVNFAGYALKAYKMASETNDFEVAHQFQRVVNARAVPVHFVGVWDTVSSVIVPGRMPFSSLKLEELPYTSNNPAVAVFRHAIAIDEFRRMFRLKHWHEPQIFRYNPHSQAKSFPAQDIRQVWFAGCHGDVGGGYVEEESGLSKFPLIWMLEQAKGHGLLLRTTMVNHIAYGRPRKNSRLYARPDAKGRLHRSLKWFWWPFELMPKAKRYRDWPKRRLWLGHYFPSAEPRFIPEGSLIHTSVFDRVKQVSSYRPLNLPEQSVQETISGPIPAATKRRQGGRKPQK